MKRFLFTIVLILIAGFSYSQGNLIYQTGITAEQNLNDIGNLSSISHGGIGFDNRYQGVKGSQRLFDTLLHSFLKVKGVENYIKLDTDLDLVNNTLIFTNPKTSKLVSLPIDNIIEVIITDMGNEMKFRTIEENKFKKKSKDLIFYQVLTEEPIQFIKIPGKDFIEAQYKGAYSPDRRYDEYKTTYKYFVMNPDGTFQQTNLSRKSLTKIFPDKKADISRTFEESKYKNNEELVLALFEKFR